MSKASTNGKAQKIAEERQHQRKHQKEMAHEQGALQEAFNSEGQLGEAFIREIVSNDDLEPGTPEGLQDETITKIQNLISRDWVLANLTEAQEHDARWKLEALKLRIYGMHPPQQSYFTGDARAFLMDDKSEALNPLTQQERVLIDEFLETVKARFTRGRGGFEREQMNTNIARTETGGEEESNNGGWGLFS